MEITGKQFRKRNAILSYLRQTKEHPSADMVFDAMSREHSDISRASVYRNLSLFKEQGLIVSLGTVDGVERFDGNVEPHVHFVCGCCGRVIDIPGMEIPSDLSAEAAAKLECKVVSSQLMLYGTCKNCLN